MVISVELHISLGFLSRGAEGPEGTPESSEDYIWRSMSHTSQRQAPEGGEYMAGASGVSREEMAGRTLGAVRTMGRLPPGPRPLWLLNRALPQVLSPHPLFLSSFPPSLRTALRASLWAPSRCLSSWLPPRCGEAEQHTWPFPRGATGHGALPGGEVTVHEGAAREAKAARGYVLTDVQPQKSEDGPRELKLAMYCFF